MPLPDAKYYTHFYLHQYFEEDKQVHIYLLILWRDKNEFTICSPKKQPKTMPHTHTHVTEMVLACCTPKACQTAFK